MARHFIFADEAGDFEFRRARNVSRYFILCTVHMDACGVGGTLLDLRRELAWAGLPVGDYFHATTDRQAVRDRVFAAIDGVPFTVQATIMEKSKAQPQVRKSSERFYQYGWFYHLKHAGPRFIDPTAELLVTAATLGTKKERVLFLGAVDDVARQTLRSGTWRTTFCPAAADPCIQIADYCAWAIQRKWERGDDRSYRLIAGKITHERDLFARGRIHYY
ncbi:MAG: DUF3800 domain-containing protein [Rhodospirillales bacterium]|nr:DUF3800 domain-containing protein [Rhodospirillales bacterium]